MEGRQLHVFAPGRTEIAGNHTDHEGGHVIAATIDRGISADACLTGEGLGLLVRIESEGFAPVSIDLSEPGAFAPREDEVGTTASLVRGVLAGLEARGVVPGGFHARMSSTIPAGGGLSSSAAFELAIAVIANELFARSRLGAADLAAIAQHAEEAFFGKPCGLMDQLAIACGGVCAFDFAKPQAPAVERIECDFGAMGLAAVLVDVGCDHSQFTDEYALVPAEMRAVARACGASRLCDVALEDVVARAMDIRWELGDRAYLRALHFYREERLTAQRAQALRAGDAARFLELTCASGASSAMFLQNVSAPDSAQPAMIALAYAQEVLDGRGAVRIHGGGFGGSIQAFVPVGLTDGFIEGMDGLLGRGSCLRVAIGGPGAGVDREAG